MLYKAQGAISSTATAEGATVASVQSRIVEFINQFARSAAGPTKWQKMVEFLRDMYPQVRCWTVYAISKDRS